MVNVEKVVCDTENLTKVWLNSVFKIKNLSRVREL